MSGANSGCSVSSMCLVAHFMHKVCIPGLSDIRIKLLGAIHTGSPHLWHFIGMLPGIT